MKFTQISKSQFMEEMEKHYSRMGTTFKLRKHQLDAFYMLTFGGYKNLLLEWGRRSGKDIFGLFFASLVCTIRKGTLVKYYMHEKQNAESVIMDGKMKDGTPLITLCGEHTINRTKKQIWFPNGSCIQMLGCTTDSEGRSRNVGQGCFVAIHSEFALADSSSIRYSSAEITETKGYTLVLTTPRPVAHFKSLKEQAIANPDIWHYSLVNSIEAGAVTQEEIDTLIRSGQTTYHTAQQEFFCNMSSLSESQYIFLNEINAAYEENRCCEFSEIKYDAPTYTAWDIGVGNATVVIIFQLTKDGKILILDCIYANGKTAEFFCDILNQYPYNCYNFQRHLLPHDAKHRSRIDGESYQKKIKEGNRDVDVVALKVTRDKSLDIQTAKNMFSRVCVDISNKNCVHLLNKLNEYRYKYNEETATYSDAPIHNSASDFADALLCMCMAVNTEYVSEYDPKNAVANEILTRRLGRF